MATVNRRITVASRPVGLPKVSDFDLVYSPLPSLAAGEVLLRSVYLSLDPCTRARMREAQPSGRAVAIGETIPGRAAAFVLESSDPDFRPGDAVEGMLGWQEYAVAQGSELRKVDPSLAPISTALGVLGIPGLVAYFGLLDVCDPQPGETVVVSGAEGAVGMVVGQIARIKGCRVVGVAGSDAAIPWLLDGLGFDGAFSYRTAAECHAKLTELCPAGVDVYFDTVGGAVTDAVMRLINVGARTAFCGEISQRNLEGSETGQPGQGQPVVRQATAQRVRVRDYAGRFPEALEQLVMWLRQGRMKYWEDVAQGLEAAPRAFIGMLQGENQGQQLVQLSEP